jgi:deoxycytidylate deaminase
MRDLPYPKMVDDVGTARHIKYLNLLAKVATDITTPIKGNNRMSACIVYQNEVVAFGVNERKSHPFQAKFLKNEHAIFLHAEVSAIKNALKHITVEELEKTTLYICRVKFTDMKKKGLMFGLSKPCCGCERCIHTFGIQNVIYTLDSGGYSVL